MIKQLERKKLHVKKGDMVEVISGKEKGHTGKIVEVSRKEGKVIIEGVNISTKHLKPKTQGAAGSIIKIELPMYSCKVMLLCPNCNKKTRIGHEKDENGDKKRKCRKCGSLF